MRTILALLAAAGLGAGEEARSGAVVGCSVGDPWWAFWSVGAGPPGALAAAAFATAIAVLVADAVRDRRAARRGAGARGRSAPAAAARRSPPAT